MPNFTFFVAPARAAMLLITSRKGSFEIRRSVCQMESIPDSSQSRTHSQ